MTVMAEWPLILAFSKSGYCVAPWFAPNGDIADVGDAHAGLLCQLGIGPVLVEACQGAEAIGRMSPALFMAISALVLAGLPTTATRTSSAATSLSACPWPTKMGPLT